MSLSPHAPLVLAFDTSTPVLCVALTCGERVIAQHEETLPRGQGEALMQICADILQENGVDFAQLDAIGVGIGPGNFTGIRISVAAARGLAFGLGVPAVGVSGFEALRFGHEGPCLCVLPAPRDHVYVQAFGMGDAQDAPRFVHAADIPQSSHPVIGQGGKSAKFPSAVAIAYEAGARFRDDPPRPTPLYLRPADAAPARDLPPRIIV